MASNLESEPEPEPWIYDFVNFDNIQVSGDYGACTSFNGSGTRLAVGAPNL